MLSSLLLRLLLVLTWSTIGRVLSADENRVFSRDDGYYTGQEFSPVATSFPTYYRNAADLLQDLSKFKTLYIQYHSCIWTDLLYSNNGDNEDANNVDENDYWYQGVNPAPTAAAAISVYGVPPDPRTRKWKQPWLEGCQRKTFLNTYVVDPQSLFLNGNSNDDGDQQYSSCANDEDNDQPYGLGCTMTGRFSYFEYSLNWQNEPVCDAKHVLSVVDALDDWNSILDDEDNDCLEVSYATARSLLTYAVSCSFEDPDCPDPVGLLRRYRNAARAPYSKSVNIVRGIALGLAGFLGVYVILVLLDEIRLACKKDKRQRYGRKQKNFHGRRDDETTPSMSGDESSIEKEAREVEPRGVMAHMSRLLGRKRSRSLSVHDDPSPSSEPIRNASISDNKDVQNTTAPQQQKRDSLSKLASNSVHFPHNDEANHEEPPKQTHKTSYSTRLVSPSTIGPRSKDLGTKRVRQDNFADSPGNSATAQPYWAAATWFQTDSKSMEGKLFSSPKVGSTASTSNWFLLSAFGVKPKSNTVDPTIPPAQPISFRSLEQTKANKNVLELPRIDEDGESISSQDIDLSTSESFIPPPYHEASMELLSRKPDQKRRWNLFPRKASKRVNVVRSGALTNRSMSNRSSKIIGFTSTQTHGTRETSLILAEATRLASQRSTSTHSSTSYRSSLSSSPTDDVQRFRSFQSVDEDILAPYHISTSGSSEESDLAELSDRYPSDEDHTVDDSSVELPSSMMCCRDEFDPSRPQSKDQESILDRLPRDMARVCSPIDSCDQSAFEKGVEMIAKTKATKSYGAQSTNGKHSREHSAPHFMNGNDKEQVSSKKAIIDEASAETASNQKLTTTDSNGARETKKMIMRSQSAQEAYEIVASPAMMRSNSATRPKQDTKKGAHTGHTNRSKYGTRSSKEFVANCHDRMQTLETSSPKRTTTARDRLDKTYSRHNGQRRGGLVKERVGTSMHSIKATPISSDEHDASKPVGIREYLARKASLPA